MSNAFCLPIRIKVARSNRLILVGLSVLSHLGAMGAVLVALQNPLQWPICGCLQLSMLWSIRTILAMPNPLFVQIDRQNRVSMLVTSSNLLDLHDDDWMLQRGWHSRHIALIRLQNGKKSYSYSYIFFANDNAAFWHALRLWVRYPQPLDPRTQETF